MSKTNQKGLIARRYLSPESCHPAHTFNSVVYSQGLRIRRIVSDNDKLKLRLDEPADAFIISDCILSKIASKSRVLSYNTRKPDVKVLVPWVIPHFFYYIWPGC